MPYMATMKIDTYKKKGINANADNIGLYYRINDDGSYDLFIKAIPWANSYINNIVGDIDLKGTISDVDIATLTAVPNS